MYLVAKNQRKDTADGVHWCWFRWRKVGYLSRTIFFGVEQLMKLTPSKRRFYQQGMRLQLYTVYLVDLFVTPPFKPMRLNWHQ
jgi:hypothetical protein